MEIKALWPAGKVQRKAYSVGAQLLERFLGGAGRNSGPGACHVLGHRYCRLVGNVKNRTTLALAPREPILSGCAHPEAKIVKHFLITVFSVR